MSAYLWDFGSGDPWLDDADDGFAGTQLDSQPTQLATTLDEEAWRETLRKLGKGFENSKWEIGLSSTANSEQMTAHPQCIPVQKSGCGKCGMRLAPGVLFGVFGVCLGPKLALFMRRD